jgi:plastocyanin
VRTQFGAVWRCCKGPASGGAVEIIADDKAFKPNTLELTSGETVTVEIRNEDDMPHDFAIEKFDLNTGTIEPGDAASASFTVPEGGVDFVCTYHSGMTGHVEAGCCASA